MEDLVLQSNGDKPTVLVGNKTGFKNQSNIKAAARSIVLEALTAFKGGKVGKRGLLVKAMAQLDKAIESENPDTRAWAVEQVLKLANGMTKDDKSSSLEDLLKGGANVQINFNTHFSQRSGSSQALTPPPRSGE